MRHDVKFKDTGVRFKALNQSYQGELLLAGLCLPGLHLCPRSLSCLPTIFVRTLNQTIEHWLYQQEYNTLAKDFSTLGIHDLGYEGLVIRSRFSI